MTLDNRTLQEKLNEVLGKTEQDNESNIITARDSTAEKVNKNLPDGWEERSMMNVHLYGGPLSKKV